ncbi:hypothetical protein [Vibrio neptunius]|uniref:Uncharacterized protein n=1 Tax=Vibrio neptunius TaxID=170651 RepID=A0ABS3A8E7_9VIBR|nr:hypothetical protein [Vibrio neptunius]MBN3495481.1 hypothetical protein [Vibrio neptunius]MBN3517485.1 hypothetical protein [Vibrio neptunius]MBN3551824.1 hypothetical protein [Vibrio neptunius]MBN3580325.1 hypothetical protein [Vibrio neptunius]MCH9873991.1 hypothetical protein [Vibrio neptunius]
MRIIYGYCDNDSIDLIGQSLETQGTFIALKPLGRLDEKLTFAALIESPEPIAFPTALPHCVLVIEQPYTHRPLKPHFVNTVTLNHKQRKSHCKKLKKHQPLNASNWTLHISRNRGLKWVRDHLNA